MGYRHLIHRLSGVGILLAFFVVLLGAYVRLSDAGLGCPDWPGCYGRLLVPQDQTAIANANTAYPERPVEIAKAWKEMVHRYLAVLLGLLILVIAWFAWRARKLSESYSLCYWLVGVVIFQGILGMWTVTLLVKPAIVLLHLVGGFTTLALLWWLRLSTATNDSRVRLSKQLGYIAKFGLCVLLIQILLGGWTSTNYAALSCPDFPTCQTKWWPSMDFSDAFTFWRELGINYEGGVLSNPSRVAIHVSHRIGAIVTTLVLLGVVFAAWRERHASSIAAGSSVALLALLTIQVGLGLGNIFLSLPMSVATAHNGGAALLVLALVYIIFHSQPIKRTPQ